jgi:hypothetical protein
MIPNLDKQKNEEYILRGKDAQRRREERLKMKEEKKARWLKKDD